MKIIISKSLFKGTHEEFESFTQSSYGKVVQKILLRRLQNVDAALNLCVLLQPGFPGDWHWLEGDRSNQIGANLNSGMRLVFEIDGGLRRYKDSSGGIDCKAITTLVLVEVINYHK